MVCLNICMRHDLSKLFDLYVRHDLSKLSDLCVRQDVSEVICVLMCLILLTVNSFLDWN